MRTLIFYGASDDSVVITEGEVTKTYAVCGDGLIEGAFDLVSVTDNATLRVYVIYDGTWSFGCGYGDSGDEVPIWRILIGPCCENNTSVQFEVCVPDDVVIVQIRDEVLGIY